MPDESNAGGQSTANTTAQPGSESNTTIPKDYEEIKTRAEKAEADLGKIREFYAQYPDLITFARRFPNDPKVQEMVRKINSGGALATEAEDKSEPDPLETLSPAQRKAVEKLMEEATGPFRSELHQLKSSYLQGQIEKWRASYNRANGWPVDFKDVEPKIAELINAGQATSAEAAYKQLSSEYFMKTKSEQDKAIRDLKVKVSMSRASIPTSMNSRAKGETKNLAQAWEEAITDLGIDE